MFDQENRNEISSYKFFSILGHQSQTLAPDPQSGSAIRKNAGSGSALNQCGSETLPHGSASFRRLIKQILFFNPKELDPRASSVADPGCFEKIPIPDPNFFYPGSRIRIKELKYFNPKNCF
jgi:hypothetical protein